ncbi:MAG: stage IV sporulation protein A [Oscillospiraceae bacterium]|nr:stage IV sporulation protein A [Oscillospiraceae bacterium]
MDTHSIYRDMAVRTGGNIYIGVVGPVRTGKSTFIKRFMETLVIPGIEDPYLRERARDELPQSGSGRTVMTSEPKFVPEEAVEIRAGGAEFSVRLIDSVGYLVDGAAGTDEEGEPRMVTTPWFDREITMAEAAEVGTRRVIAEHSTVGVVMTTDGSITEIPRESYVPAEERAVAELKALGKPFILVLNAADPAAPAAQALRRELEEKYSVDCVAVSCLHLTEADVSGILGAALREFPIAELGVDLPEWLDALPPAHPLKSALYGSLREACADLRRLRDAETAAARFALAENVERAEVASLRPDTGCARIRAELPRSLFYRILTEESGVAVSGDGDLLGLLTDAGRIRREYDRVSGALREVREKGYGVVLPEASELKLAEPEIVRQGGKYSVRLKASAPSIHMILANIETEVSPAIAGGKQSEDVINYLLQEFEGDTGKIWESNVFGKSLYDIASEGLQAKIKRLPEDSRFKLQEALQRIVNEGANGMICILL